MQLQNRVITVVRAMNATELAAEDWTSRAKVPVLVLDDSTCVYPGADAAGQRPGCWYSAGSRQTLRALSSLVGSRLDLGTDYHRGQPVVVLVCGSARLMARSRNGEGVGAILVRLRDTSSTDGAPFFLTFGRESTL